MERLIIGCGYLGRRVAARWLAAGDGVAALTRTEENAAELEKLGIRPIIGDVMQPETLDQLPPVDTVLWAVGWDRQSGLSQRDVYVDGLKNCLRHVAPDARWIYVSSSSVYGQSAGEWVDEASVCDPSQPNGKVCLEAENQLRGSAPERHGSSRVILRLSGIYGPGRLLSRVSTLQQGETIAGNPDAWLNLIHVDDAADAVIRAGEQIDLGPLYLISDDQPITRRTYYGALASLVGAPPPCFEGDTASSVPAVGGTRTVGLNKRCRNTLARQTLSWTLRYPTHLEGLPHAVSTVE